MICFDGHIEIDLIERGLPAEDIPTEWNKRYDELLGIKPSNDSIVRLRPLNL